MENRDMFEDCRGLLWERDLIPAEHDVYRKMKPEWKRLYYPDGYYQGRLLYEGFTVDHMAYGAGTSYYGGGGRCQEGVFGPNGLVCGREYYITGQLRFEGTYQYNADYGRNWPVFGAFYSAAGELKYYGAFDVIGTGDESVRPLVMEPEDFGPVASLLPDEGYLFTGEKAGKYYDVSDAYKEKILEEEKEGQRKAGPVQNVLGQLREYLNNPCPEYREMAAEELKRLGAWTEKDGAVLERTRERCRPPRTRLSPETRFIRDLDMLDFPDFFLREYRKKIDRTPDGELDALLDRFAGTAESNFPYLWGKDPRHKRIGVPLEERGISIDNWMQHIDEMSDREISYMLDQEPCFGSRTEGLLVRPEMSLRAYAEFMRDFGL